MKVLFLLALSCSTFVLQGQVVLDSTSKSRLMQKYLSANAPKDNGTELYRNFRLKKKVDSILHTIYPTPRRYLIKYNPEMSEARPAYMGKKGLPYHMQPFRYDYLYEAKKRSLQEK